MIPARRIGLSLHEHPCGCVFDLDRDDWIVDEKGYVLECSWCGATFNADDLERWDKKPPVVMVNHPGTAVFKAEDRFFLVVRRCQCGDVLLCEQNTEHHIHLRDLKGAKYLEN